MAFFADGAEDWEECLMALAPAEVPTYVFVLSSAAVGIRFDHG
jgi:hypothetical protein